MNVGITGSKGFIGKALKNALDKKPSVETFEFDLPEKNLLNLGSLKNFVKDKDVIVHAATKNRGTDTEIITSGIIGAYNLISAVKNSGRKTRIIFLSSLQSGNGSVFGSSKELAENLFRDFSENHKAPVIALRITNVFGEGCHSFYNSVVATFCYQIANNKKLIVKDEKKEINFIYIDDLIKTILKEVFQRRKNGFYLRTVTTKNLISIGELAKLITSFKKIKKSKAIKSKFHRDLYKTFLSHQQL